MKMQQVNGSAATTYSQFMGKLKNPDIGINRKVLSDLAMNNPAAFSAIVNKVK